MSVLVLERSAHLGGGACTSEGPAPGFLMNHCSHWTRFYAHPAYRDFALYDEGLRYVFPEQNEGMIFDDGSSLIGHSAYRVVDPATGRQERSEENIRATWEQIARFSARDAETYLQLLDAHERHWKQAFRRHRFSPPPPWGTPDPLEQLLDVPGTYLQPVHQFMTLGQLARDFFESPELQTLFIRAATTSTGCFPDDVPGLPGADPLPSADAVVRAGGDRDRRQPGDHRRAGGGREAARRAIRDELRGRSHRGARATGPPAVELTDGTRIAAELVVSDLGLPLTRAAAPARASRSRRASAAARPATSTTTAASCSGPTWPSTSRRVTWPSWTTPGSARSLACTGAPRTWTTSTSAISPRSTSNGFASRPYVLCSVDSLWDQTRAPAGQPHRRRRGVRGAAAQRSAPSDWRGIKDEFSRQPPRAMGRYAPNMTLRTSSRCGVYGPDDIERERPNMIEGGYSTA